MLPKYSHRYSITAADMDTQYLMTPSAVLLYYQDCWARYMSCLNLAAFDMSKRQMLWVITEFNACFTSEHAFWSDEIEVEVWNSEISAVRLYSDFIIRRADTHAELVHGFGCWNLLNSTQHKIVSTDLIREQITIVPELTTEHHKRKRITAADSVLQKVEHKVNPINLDFNGHVNNRTYLEIAIQTATEGFLSHNQVKNFAIYWKHETFLGEVITCELRKSEEQFVHVLTKNEGVEVAQIISEWVPKTLSIDVADVVSRT